MARKSKTPPKKAAGPVDAEPRLERLERLVKILEASSLAELAYEDEDIAVTLRRTAATSVAASVERTYVSVPAPAALPAPPTPPPAENAVDARAHLIRSPFVGTFYRSPSPETPSFVEVGQRITKGQTVCIVEAMKLMNEIESDVDGVVLEVLIENSQAVQYGDALFKVRLDGA